MADLLGSSGSDELYTCFAPLSSEQTLQLFKHLKHLIQEVEQRVNDVQQQGVEPCRRTLDILARDLHQERQRVDDLSQSLDDANRCIEDTRKDIHQLNANRQRIPPELERMRLGLDALREAHDSTHQRVGENARRLDVDGEILRQVRNMLEGTTTPAVQKLREDIGKAEHGLQQHHEALQRLRSGAKLHQDALRATQENLCDINNGRMARTDASLDRPQHHNHNANQRARERETKARFQMASIYAGILSCMPETVCPQGALTVSPQHPSRNQWCAQLFASLGTFNCQFVSSKCHVAGVHEKVQV